MLPVLLDFGFIKIYTFGVFMVLAFFWGAFFLWKNISLTAFKEDEVFDGLFFSLMGSLLVGRLVYVAFHFADFGYDMLRFLLINGYPGLDVMGMIAGFFLFFGIFAHWKKISFMRLMDYMTAPFFLALGIAKLGSFFSGSEVGGQTSFFLSLSYPNLDGTRHLTSLYESIFFFLGSFLTYKILRQIRRGKLYEGFTLGFFIWYVALISTVFDPLKTFQTQVQQVSLHLALGGIMLLTVSIYFIYYFRTPIMRFTLARIKKKK